MSKKRTVDHQPVDQLVTSAVSPQSLTDDTGALLPPAWRLREFFPDMFSLACSIHNDVPKSLPSDWKKKFNLCSLSIWIRKLRCVRGNGVIDWLINCHFWLEMTTWSQMKWQLNSLRHQLPPLHCDNGLITYRCAEACQTRNLEHVALLTISTRPVREITVTLLTFKKKKGWALL